MTSKVIYIDRGWQPVDIGFCPDKQAWDREMRRLNTNLPWPETETSAAHTQHMRNDTTGASVVIVTVFPACETDALSVISAMVHEAVHVWQFICQKIGEDEPGMEMEAYAVQHITEGLIAAYCKTRGKGRDWFAA